jgi:hypothetical protein
MKATQHLLPATVLFALIAILTFAFLQMQVFAETSDKDERTPLTPDGQVGRVGVISPDGEFVGYVYERDMRPRPKVDLARLATEQKRAYPVVRNDNETVVGCVDEAGFLPVSRLAERALEVAETPVDNQGWCEKPIEHSTSVERYAN